MTRFDEDLRRKEKAEEARWSFRQEKAFEIMAKRDKLFGVWAAGLLGLTGDGAVAYIRAVIETGVTLGDDAMLGKVGGDLAAAGVAQDAGALAARLAECEAAAQAMVARGNMP